MNRFIQAPISSKLRTAVPTQSVIGFPIASASFEKQIDVIIEWARASLSRVVCVSNVHMLMEGHWSPDFAEVLKSADLLTPDGMPLVWMTGLMKGKPQDRVAGMDLMLGLCRRAQAEKISIFLLGSTDDVLTKMRERLALEFPRLEVVGAISPPFRQLSEAEEHSIILKINRSGAGLVFVCFGCPKQERWMSKHRGRIKTVMVGLGGAFAIYAGINQWAPPWVRKYGLEWCHRLVQEPRRLWKRYASTIPPFIWLAFKQVVKVQLGIDPDRSFRQSQFKDG